MCPWIEDPDGNSWEVFVVKADAPVMKGDAPMNMDVPAMKAGASAAKGEAAACCAPSCCAPKVNDAG